MPTKALPVNRHNRYHFAQLDDQGLCVKKVNPDGTPLPCGQNRDGDRHLYYPCTKNDRCRVKSWSIEQRMKHEEESHR